MDGKAGEGISGVEGEIYKKTSVSSTGLRFKKMRIEVGILDYTTGGVLFMECEDRK